MILVEVGSRFYVNYGKAFTILVFRDTQCNANSPHYHWAIEENSVFDELIAMTVLNVSG